MRNVNMKHVAMRLKITQFKSETGVQWVGLPSGDKLFPKIFVTDECYYNDCRY